MEKLIKWATVFCLFGISSAVFLLLASPTEDPLTGERIMQETPLWYNLYGVSFLVVAVLLIASKIDKVLSFVYANKLLLLLLIYMLASCVWALDPWLSFIDAYKTIIAVLFGFFLATRFSAKELLSILCITMGIMVVSSFVIAIFLPEYGVHQTGYVGAWRGAWGHKNQLAIRMNIAFVTFVMAAVHFKKSRQVYAFFAFLAATLVVLSQSGTGICILLLIIFSPLYLLFLRLHGALVITLALTLLCLGGLIYILAGEPDISTMFLIALDKDPTLSGRTETWQGVLYALTDYRSSHAIFGYGAQPWQMTTHGQIITEHVEDSITVDNVYMDVLLKYGLVGSVPCALVLYQGLSIALEQLKTRVSVLSNFYIVVMLIMFINGISENVDTVRLLWTFFALTLASPYIRDDKKPGKFEKKYA